MPFWPLAPVLIVNYDDFGPDYSVWPGYIYRKTWWRTTERFFFSLSLSFILWMSKSRAGNFKIITYYIPILCSIVNFEFFSLWISLIVNFQRAGISKLFLSFFTTLYHYTTTTCTTLCLSSITFLAVSYTPPH